MLDSILGNTGGSITLVPILICTGVSLLLGTVIAVVYMFRNTYTKNLVVAFVLLPALVQSVIMLVNGNIGAGVAVLGAFSLVRFRSAPGTAKEIACIFFAMAVGLATGMGYVWYAVLFTAIISLAIVILTITHFGENNSSLKTLKITIPEDVDYKTAFDDLFQEYTKEATLERARTTNLGSLFELQYTILLKEEKREKELLDKLRQRNGNLSISCGINTASKGEL